MTADFTPEPINPQAKEILDAVQKRMTERHKGDVIELAGVIVLLDGGRDQKQLRETLRAWRERAVIEPLGQTKYVTHVDDLNFARFGFTDAQSRRVYRPSSEGTCDPQTPEFPTLTPKQKQQAKAREKTHENVRRKPPRSIR